MVVGPCASLVVLGAVAFQSLAVEIPLPDLVGTQARVQQAVRDRYQMVLSSADAEAWGAYGMTLDAHRFVEAAIVAYREAHALDPEEFRWPYYLAILVGASEPLEATTWFERALAVDPRYAPAQILYAESLEGIGEIERAREGFTRARELDPRNALAPFGLGRIALRRGEIERAVDLLQRADELGPPTQAIVASLARAYQRAGQHERASRRAAEARQLPRMVHHRDERRAAVQILALDSESYLRRSRTYSEVGRLDRALQELEEILALEPELAEAHLAAGGVYDLMGRSTEALAAVESAMRLGADPGEARPLRASLLFKLERFDEAEDQARIVLLNAPNDVHILLLLTMAAAQREDLGSMIETLDLAYVHRTRDPALERLMIRLLDDVGAMFAGVGRFDVAVRRLEQVLEILDELGEPAAAVETYRHRLELYRSGQSP